MLYLGYELNGLCSYPYRLSWGIFCNMNLYMRCVLKLSDFFLFSKKGLFSPLPNPRWYYISLAALIFYLGRRLDTPDLRYVRNIYKSKSKYSLLFWNIVTPSTSPIWIKLIAKIVSSELKYKAGCNMPMNRNTWIRIIKTFIIIIIFLCKWLIMQPFIRLIWPLWGLLQWSHDAYKGLLRSKTT